MYVHITLKNAVQFLKFFKMFCISNALETAMVLGGQSQVCLGLLHVTIFKILTELNA